MGRARTNSCGRRRGLLVARGTAAQALRRKGSPAGTIAANLGVGAVVAPHGRGGSRRRPADRPERDRLAQATTSSSARERPAARSASSATAGSFSSRSTGGSPATASGSNSPRAPRPARRENYGWRSDSGGSTTMAFLVASPSPWAAYLDRGFSAFLYRGFSPPTPLRASSELEGRKSTTLRTSPTGLCRPSSVTVTLRDPRVDAQSTTAQQAPGTVKDPVPFRRRRDSGRRSRGRRGARAFEGPWTDIVLLDDP